MYRLREGPFWLLMAIRICRGDQKTESSRQSLTHSTADIDKAAEWKSKTVAGWWADMQKVAVRSPSSLEVTVGEMTDEVPVADLVNQAFEDMEKKKAEEKNVFGSFDTADSGPELLTSILEYKFSSLFPILSGVATFDLWGDPIFFVFVLKSASKYTE
ncbi:hypothetical protein SNK04_005974 [Fusarium graminearum]